MSYIPDAIASRACRSAMAPHAPPPRSAPPLQSLPGVLGVGRVAEEALTGVYVLAGGRAPRGYFRDLAGQGEEKAGGPPPAAEPAREGGAARLGLVEDRAEA